jgi:hypothetical protein
MKYHKVDEGDTAKVGCLMLAVSHSSCHKHNVTVTVFPGDFFISKFYTL